jgi:hypothetical protein
MESVVPLLVKVVWITSEELKTDLLLKNSIGKKGIFCKLFTC